MIRTLITVDDLLLKAAGAPLESTFRVLERRLFMSLARTWAKRAQRAVDSALRILDSGEVDVSPAVDIERMLGAMAAHFDAWPNEMKPVLDAVVAEAYTAGKRQMMLKISGRFAGGKYNCKTDDLGCHVIQKDN